MSKAAKGTKQSKARERSKAAAGSKGPNEVRKPKACAKEKLEKLSDEELIINSPFLTDKEKRLKLYEIRTQRVKRALAVIEEEERWELEIREEEERRAKLERYAMHKKQCETSEESDDEDTQSDSDDEDSKNDSE